MNKLTQKHATPAVALVVGILVLAMNLRAPFTSLAPVLNWIKSDFLLSTASVGALTSLPLIAFAAFSPFSAAIAHRFGLERTLFGALVTMIAGIAMRSSGSYWMLYAGTACIGIGGALGNVLLPGLLKRDFSGNIASMTGAYAIAMGLGGALGSSVVIPLTEIWGWQTALLLLGFMPLLALVIWSPQLKKHSDVPNSAKRGSAGADIWRSSLAWQVTLYMGFNAMLFYIAIAWLPVIVMEQGVTAGKAGSMHGILQLASALPGLIAGATLGRLSDQRIPAAGVSLLSAVSLLGILCAPGLTLIWSALLGFGCGASMIMGLTFVGLRTTTAGEAATLSGMSQSVGYLFGASGPMILGMLRDFSGSWTIPLLVALALAILGAWMGTLAGRNIRIA